MRVLSLFDGMSCGQQALERAGFIVDKYFASEIDKHAIKVTMANYPNTIQLGSVIDVDGYKLGKIDILLGGSPCQSFSFAGKRKGMATKTDVEILTLEQYLQYKKDGYEFEGQSYLFWEYMRLLNEVKPTYFLLENVVMGEKWERVLSKAIGVKPICINSALVSAQNRNRLYWTNIGLEPAGLFGYLESTIKQPKDKGVLLGHILQKDVDVKYYLSDKMLKWLEKRVIKPSDINGKSKCFTAGGHSGGLHSQMDLIVHNTMPRSSTTGKGGSGPLSRNDGKTYCLDTGNTNAVEVLRKGVRKNKLKIRRLTPIECERLQTVKDNYTNHVSDTQRYKMLGNGWTIDVITHILNYIKK
jgi:DNA (cytosine-5)-methyltransferase 3A